MAAAGGAVAGMALGYGIGRFPRPHFEFHNPQEEYYYNYYMYRKYGMRSTDKNDFSRDYEYSQIPTTFDKFMDSCMKRTDLLPEKKQKPSNEPVAATTKTITAASVNTTTTAATVTDAGSNATKMNTTAATNSLTTAPSTPQPLNKSEVSPPASQALRDTPAAEDDDDTVSIVEIGYPALIKQVKVKRCTELYIVYAEKHLKKKKEPTPRSGGRGLEVNLRGFLSVVTSTILMLLNNDIQTLLHAGLH